MSLQTDERQIGKKYVTINHFDQRYKKPFQKLDKRLLARSLEGALVRPLKRANDRLTDPLTK